MKMVRGGNSTPSMVYQRKCWTVNSWPKWNTCTGRALTVEKGIAVNALTNILIIDDDRVRLPTLRAWARSQYGEGHAITFKTYVPKSFLGYDVLLLDHDLGNEGDVYDVLRKRNLDYFEGDVIVHSMNPVGAQNIARLFRQAWVVVKPYSSMVQDLA